MGHIFGLFDSQKKGDTALAALEKAGVNVGDIEVMNSNDPSTHLPAIGATVRTSGMRVEQLDGGKTNEELLLEKGVAEHNLDDFIGVIQHGGAVVIVKSDAVAQISEVLQGLGAEVRTADS